MAERAELHEHDRGRVDDARDDEQQQFEIALRLRHPEPFDRTVRPSSVETRRVDGAVARRGHCRRWHRSTVPRSAWPNRRESRIDRLLHELLVELGKAGHSGDPVSS